VVCQYWGDFPHIFSSRYKSLILKDYAVYVERLQYIFAHFLRGFCTKSTTGRDSWISNHDSLFFLREMRSIFPCQISHFILRWSPSAPKFSYPIDSSQRLNSRICQRNASTLGIYSKHSDLFQMFLGRETDPPNIGASNTFSYKYPLPKKKGNPTLALYCIFISLEKRVVRNSRRHCDSASRVRHTLVVLLFHLLRKSCEA
jgi:hypothetical protein